MKRSRMIIIAAILIAVAASGYLYFGTHLFHDHGPVNATRYTCPMHPQIVSDRPGDCPICGMKLVPIEPARTPADTSATAPGPGGDAGARRVLHYRNPMDPSVTSPVPMQDPMGMDYVPVYADESAETATAGMAGHAAVEIGSEGLRLAGRLACLGLQRAARRQQDQQKTKNQIFQFFHVDQSWI